MGDVDPPGRRGEAVLPSGADANPDVRGAADTYLHEVATSQTRDLSTWLGNRHAWPEEWNRTWDMSSATLRLTPELTQELIEKMHALIDTYRHLATEEDGAAQVRIHTHAFPLTDGVGSLYNIMLAHGSYTSAWGIGGLVPLLTISAAYLFAGVGVFNLGEHVAKNRGTLGRY